MDWFYLSGFLEALIIIFALCSSLYFVYLIAIATFLQATCRPFLMLFTVSLFFLALTHGFQTFEFLIGLRPEDSNNFEMSMRMYVWSLLHQFAFALHTFSLFMFSLERFITAKYSITQSTRNSTIAIVLGVIITILSMIIAQILHFVDFHIITITCLNIVDMAALVISDVYIWTQAVIPAACVAFLLKFTYVLVIWLLRSVENSMSYQIAFSHFFQNVLDLFTIAIPFLVSTNHRRLRKLKLRGNRVNPANASNRVITLDGKSIRMKGTIHDHFDFLKNHWK